MSSAKYKFKISNNKYLVILLIFTLSACRIDEITEQEIVIEKEQKVIEKIEKIMPDQVVSQYQAHFTEMQNDVNYSTYLDSFNVALTEFIDAVEANYSLHEFEEAYEKVLSNGDLLKSAAVDKDNKGIGYAKALELNPKVAGKAGLIVYGGLEAGGGGGIKIIYDFVNQDRQLYYYSLCNYGYTAGVGIGAELGLLGFNGVHEVITGIPYMGNIIQANKFEGTTLSKSHSIEGAIALLFEIELDLGIGTTYESHHDLRHEIGEWIPCPNRMIKITNGITSYFFQVSKTIGVGATLKLAYNSNKIGTNMFGVNSTYISYNKTRGREVAALRMARNLVLPEPEDGFSCIINPFDIAASAIALAYGFKDFDDNSYDSPSVGTLEVDDDDIEITRALCGGVMTYDGGNPVDERGVVWNTTGNPTLENYEGNEFDYNKSQDEFLLQVDNLFPDEKYYFRAYAINAAGVTYGDEESFRTKKPETGDIAKLEYGGKTYKVVYLDKEWWFAENLAYDVGTGCWPYDDNESNVSTYGRLYRWEAANGACPEGWHLPSDSEWESLAKFISNENGGYSKENYDWFYVGNHLKSKSGWASSGNGTDDYYFNGLPAGGRAIDGSYMGKGTHALWWSSSPVGSTEAKVRMITNTASAFVNQNYDKESAFSVRCIKN